MKITQTPRLKCPIVEPTVFEDERGYFFESFHAQKFGDLGLATHFVQDNQSQSEKGVLRGLHYQLVPAAQGKLIRVLSGEIFDVAVDIRKSSATFGQWDGVHLSKTNRLSFYIPPGFAHGFLVLSDTAEILYKCTAHYNPRLERVIRWDDPSLNIAWPLNNNKPILSDKDRGAPFLTEAETNF